jgi:hypothetical protein
MTNARTMGADSLSQRNIYNIMDRWEQQTEQFNSLEDLVDDTMETLINHRPGRFSKKFDDEGMKIALETYLSLMKNGGALREAVKELRSITTRFPGQIMDCEDAIPQICSACSTFPIQVRDFLKLYCR